MTHTKLALTLTPEDILEHWPTQGALWLMEDPQLFTNHTTAFINAVNLCTNKPEHQTLLEDAAKATQFEILFTIARNINAPPQILVMLSTHNEWLVRKEVAGNAGTPADSLQVLATDQHWSVRQSVAQNINTSTDILEFLSSDKHMSVREGVASNSATPSHILYVFAKEGFWLVEKVIENTKVPRELLRALSRHKNQVVRDLALNRLRQKR